MSDQADLTKSQARELEGLVQIFPGKVPERLEDSPEGNARFDLEAQGVYEITPQGKVLRPDPAVALPGHEGEAAASAEVEDASPQTSDEGAGVGNDPAGPEGPVPSPDRQNGEGALDEASSPEASEVDPSLSTSETAALDQGVAVEQAASGSHLPQGEPGALAPTPGFMPLPGPDSLPQNQREAAFEAMSLADERQILMEMEGQALSSMVYGFGRGNNKVYGLSWIGARETARSWNQQTGAGIRIAHEIAPQFEEIQKPSEIGWDAENKKPLTGKVDAVRVSVYGLNAQTGFGLWASAIAEREQVNKDENKRDEAGHYRRNPDGFAEAKALSKAQRNALEAHIPRWFVEEMISRYKGDGQIEYIDAEATEVYELPPALTDEKALAQMDKCRELYAEFKRLVGPKSKTPAWFQQQLTNAQDSHAKLDDLIQALTDLVDQAKAYVAEQAAKQEEAAEGNG